MIVRQTSSGLRASKVAQTRFLILGILLSHAVWGSPTATAAPILGKSFCECECVSGEKACILEPPLNILGAEELPPLPQPQGSDQLSCTISTEPGSADPVAEAPNYSLTNDGFDQESCLALNDREKKIHCIRRTPLGGGWFGRQHGYLSNCRLLIEAAPFPD
jgi:hypothetical protein